MFHKGSVRIDMLDAQGHVLAFGDTRIPVSPLDAFELQDHAVTSMQDDKLKSAITIQLILCSEQGHAIGQLTETTIPYLRYMTRGIRRWIIFMYPATISL